MLQKDLFLEWMNSDDPAEYSNVLENYEFIKYLDERLFRKYEPTKSPGLNFLDRLAGWLSNVDGKEHQKTLYNLVSKIFFVGEEEFNALYRVAFLEIVVPWLITKESLCFSNKDYKEGVYRHLSETWFCPISDSLRISAFYHVNNIAGRDYRPDWRCLSKFSNEDKLKNFIEQSGIKRIVLLEDFVGSGGQASTIVGFIRKLDLKVEVLIVPLLICPKGDDALRLSVKKDKYIEYRPVVVIPKSEIFTVEEIDGENDYIREVREINAKHSEKIGVDFKVDNAERVKVGSFGYKNTGALVVMYSNCPNNTLALIHKDNSLEWKSLFPRSERLES